MKDIRSTLQSTLGASYTLERELGGGGMSRVFVADETALGRKVVVKVLSPELAAGVSAERFTREIRMAASLQQANIVPVLTSGETNGLPYFTMPFVEGESLRARLGKQGALSVTEIVGVLRDVARALAYAHEHNVVHRDIKPDNVLLSGGTAVVTDFGIAKALSAARDEERGATLTQLGTSIGTPAYMSPEQAAGDPGVDYRTDIYSLGAMAYELLAGRSPFHGRTPQRMLAAHMSETPHHLGELRPDAPPQLVDLVMRCLEKDAAARPQSAAEVARILDSVTSGSGMASMPAILLGGRGMFKKALGLYAAAFVVVAVVARAAIIAIGLPDWVFAGALVVMALGLPVILFTGYAHHVARRAVVATPTYTPGGTPTSLPQGTMATMAFKAGAHLSWNRALMGGVYALASFVLLVGAYMLLRALGVGPFASLLSAGTLSTRDQIIVTDFKTAPSDSALSGVMAEAMRANLSQSRVVAIMPTSSIAGALTRMQRPTDARLDLALARGIAAREGVKAILTGELTPLSAGYIVSAKLVAGATGDELASYQETVNGPAELIGAADRLARKLRGKIGESLKSVRADAPLMHATTASLEALKKYTEGFRANLTGDYPRAVRVLEEAIAIDSGFGMAYRVLAQVMSNGGIRTSEIPDVLDKAFAKRGRMTERERLMTVGTYYTVANGRHRDRQKGIEAYERLIQLHPDDYGAVQNLGQFLYQRRQLARSESAFVASIRLMPDQQFAYFNAVGPLIDQGKFDETRRMIAAGLDRNPGHPRGNLTRADLLYNEGKVDSAIAALTVAAASTVPLRTITAHFNLAAVSRVRGRLSDWRKHTAAARSINERRGISVAAYVDSVTAASFPLWYLDEPTTTARRLDGLLARGALSGVPQNQRPNQQLAVLYAGAGQPDKARAMLTAFQASLTDTARRRLNEPALRTTIGWIALAENRPLDALAELRAGSMLPDGPVNECSACDDALLGLAFDRANLRDSAIVTYSRYLTRPNSQRWNVDATFRPWITKRLGELYEQQGDRVNAALRYREFVELWKNADPELQPRVADVRRRLARLGNIETR